MSGNFQRNAYLSTQIQTASKDKLLMMLLDGALKFSHQARRSIEERSIGETSSNCIKVQNIITELMGALDKDLISEELYKNLMSLYVFVHKRMVTANLERKTKYVDEAIQIIERLREIWSVAINQVLEANGGKLPDLPEDYVPNRSAGSAPSGAGAAPMMSLPPSAPGGVGSTAGVGRAAASRVYQQGGTQKSANGEVPQTPQPAPAAQSANPLGPKPTVNLGEGTSDPNKKKVLRKKLSKKPLGQSPASGAAPAAPVSPEKKEAALGRPKINLAKRTS